MKSLSALVVTRNGERIVGFILGLDCRDILVAADELQKPVCMRETVGKIGEGIGGYGLEPHLRERPAEL